MKAVFIDLIFDEIFLVKGKSEILKYFFKWVPPSRVGGGANAPDPDILQYVLPLSFHESRFFSPYDKTFEKPVCNV